MSNIAFYLKYRPQSLNDLVSQDHVKKIISGAFAQNRLSHAYLFVGPRGTGKTSAARILAKMVNCESQESRVKSQDKDNSNNPRLSTLATRDFPCNKCSTCLSITDGSNLDLIEIDAASNRGIEDIRSLREKIKLSPTNSKKKVYIIDEVHMLTPEAFNALLKTLEEPPSHALFILATTDIGKLPQTIISRVQRLDFMKASSQDLMQVLAGIIKKEKIDIDEEAIQLLIKNSDGSFRDAIKLLDQLCALNKKIKANDVIASIKGVIFEQVYNMLESLADKNTRQSIILIQKLMEDGVDIKILTTAMMEVMRDILLIKNDLGPDLVQKVWSDKYDILQKLAAKFETNDATKVLKILQEALEKLKYASIPQLPLELAMVEICGGESSSPVGAHSHQSSDIPPNVLQPSSQQPSSNDDILKLKEKWTFVLETIRPFNFSLEALLRSINITECSDTTIIMEVPYSFHQRILEAPKNRDLLESIISDILGRSIRVSTVLGNRTQNREDIVNIEVAADDEIIRAAAEIFNSDSIN